VFVKGALAAGVDAAGLWAAASLLSTEKRLRAGSDTQTSRRVKLLMVDIPLG